MEREGWEHPNAPRGFGEGKLTPAPKRRPRGPWICRADLPHQQRLDCALGPPGSSKPIFMGRHARQPAAPPRLRAGHRCPSDPRRPLCPTAGGGSDWRHPTGGFGPLHPPAPSSAKVHAPFPLLASATPVAMGGGGRRDGGGQRAGHSSSEPRGAGVEGEGRRRGRG